VVVGMDSHSPPGCPVSKRLRLSIKIENVSLICICSFLLWQHCGSCYYPKAVNYDDYGGRGITVCDRWKDSFENFYADMGDPPSEDHSIERSDTNGHYEPGNCTWATRIAQQNNRRNTIVITYNGKTQGLSEWARELGIARTTLEMRRSRGWSDVEALTGTRIARP
jgi:hypothetical protein